MKSNLLIRMWTMLILGMTFANAALAVPHISPSDGGDGSPSAPEPGSILMIVIGLVLVGGYLLWRQRRRANTTAAK